MQDYANSPFKPSIRTFILYFKFALIYGMDWKLWIGTSHRAVLKKTSGREVIELRLPDSSIEEKWINYVHHVQVEEK